MGWSTYMGVPVSEPPALTIIVVHPVEVCAINTASSTNLMIFLVEVSHKSDTITFSKTKIDYFKEWIKAIKC